VDKCWLTRARKGGTRVAVAFATKLRMAAAALGCNSRKDLCARFRSVNPATQCDLDRLNKWVQGRSLPRAASVYADLAAIIGTAKPGRWIADCSVEEFAAELADRIGVDTATLAVPDKFGSRGNPRVAGLFGGIATLTGTFAAYSPAWSPHFRGRLVRGALRLSRGASGALIATYTESLFGRDVRLSAEAWIGGRSMHLAVREPDGDVPVFISLQIPGPPASVLCGVMSGMAFVSHEPLQSACRIVFIRVPDTPRLDGTNRYFDPVPGAVAADLAGLGLHVRETDRLDAFMREFLGTAPIQVTTQHQGAFADMLDREHLDVTAQRSASSDAATRIAGRKRAHRD
jgi:hypothetical protein